MNPIIDLLQSHQSIRQYMPDPIPEEALQAIVQSAQRASTSSNVQAYSVIAVTDKEMQRKLSEVASNQQHVAQCPLLLIWCADLSRHRLVCDRQGVEMNAGTTENFVTATVDAALAAQNAAIAAESLGYGIVYVGGLRNNLREVTRLLNVPQLVYPLFGMCIGVPDQQPLRRPRLPVRAVLHREVYDGAGQEEAIGEYDEATRVYYRERTNGKRESTWSNDMAEKFRRPARIYLRDYLLEQGFRLE
ncbi:MAG: oxygen-insensitive nitroreductase [Paenibacillus sp.]|nr:oxygen-insensitive nitroreductase [Paenibacillus sp.]